MSVIRGRPACTGWDAETQIMALVVDFKTAHKAVERYHQRERHQHRSQGAPSCFFYFSCLHHTNFFTFRKKTACKQQDGSRWFPIHGQNRYAMFFLCLLPSQRLKAALFPSSLGPLSIPALLPATCDPGGGTRKPCRIFRRDHRWGAGGTHQDGAVQGHLSQNRGKLQAVLHRGTPASGAFSTTLFYLLI